MERKARRLALFMQKLALFVHFLDILAFLDKFIKVMDNCSLERQRGLVLVF